MPERRLAQRMPSAFVPKSELTGFLVDNRGKRMLTV